MHVHTPYLGDINIRLDAWAGRATCMRHSSRQHAQLQTKEIAPSFIHKSWYKAYISESGGLEDAPKESKFRFWHDEKRFKVS